MVKAISDETNHAVEVKPGKFLSMLKPYLNKEYKDYEIENFVNKWKKYSGDIKEDNFIVKVVKGKDIIRYYQANVIADSNHSNTLKNSCMKNANPKSLDLYVLNPNQMRMIVVLDENDLLHGRALIYKLDDDKLFLDCSYYINSYEDTLIYNFFKNTLKGDYAYDDLNLPSNSKVKLDISPMKLKMFPYLDTFKYWNDDNKYLYQNDSNFLNGLKFDNDKGKVTTIGNIVLLDNNKGLAYEKDTVMLYDNTYALKDDTVELFNGEFALEDECVLDYKNEYILKRDAVMLYDGKYSLKINTITNNKGTILKK